MVSPSVYLDTSVINFLFAQDAPEKKEITLDFFDNFLMPGKYRPFVSEFVIEEINQTQTESKRNALLNVINDYPIEILEITDAIEVRRLAGIYISEKILPEKNVVDALHVAVCVLQRLDY